jgi:hypothetical protein
MEAVPDDIVGEIMAHNADNRWLGAACRRFRAVFAAIDGAFWRARGMRRAALACARTAPIPRLDHLIAVDNLEAVLIRMQAREMSPNDAIYIAIRFDAHRIFEQLRATGTAPVRQLKYSIINAGAAKCFRVIKDDCPGGERIPLVLVGTAGDPTKLAEYAQILQMVTQAVTHVGTRTFISSLICAMSGGTTRAESVEFLRGNIDGKNIEWMRAAIERVPELRDTDVDAIDLDRFVECMVDDRMLMALVGVSSKQVIKRTVLIGRKIFDLRRDCPRLLPRFAQSLERQYPHEARLCARMYAEVLEKRAG